MVHKPTQRGRDVLPHPSRTQSSSRFRAAAASVPSASTIPPAPLGRMADHRSIEWWLDAHMTVASNLLCLEQIVDDASPQVLHRTLVPLGELRDTLYEVYCDAGDPRLVPLVKEGSPFSTYVRALYEFCEDVLESVLPFASDMQRGQADVGRVRAALRAAGDAFQTASRGLVERVEGELSSVAVDTSDAIDPLRNLRRNFTQIVGAAGELERAIVGGPPSQP